MKLSVIAASILNNTTNKYLVVCMNKHQFLNSSSSIQKISNDSNTRNTLYATQTRVNVNRSSNQLFGTNKTCFDEHIDPLLKLVAKKESQLSGESSPSEKLLTNSDSQIDSSKDKNTDPNGKPPLEKLIKVKELLTTHLPKFFQETHMYALYTPDLIFENFYKEPGKITVGALPYAVQLTLLRWKVHWKFSYVKLELLKVTHDEKDGTIKVRWRINGVRGVKSMIQPWKIKVWEVKQTIKKESEWHDGFSVLYLRNDGLIYKHRMQRVMENNDELKNETEKKVKVATNLDVGAPM